MAKLIVFPNSNTTTHSDMDSCICCNQPVTKQTSHILDMAGDQAGIRTRAVMCNDCEKDMPSWLWHA